MNSSVGGMEIGRIPLSLLASVSPSLTPESGANTLGCFPAPTLGHVRNRMPDLPAAWAPGLQDGKHKRFHLVLFFLRGLLERLV